MHKITAIRCRIYVAENVRNVNFPIIVAEKFAFYIYQVQDLCELFGKSKQAYYKYDEQRVLCRRQLLLHSAGFLQKLSIPLCHETKQTDYDTVRKTTGKG